MHLSLEFTLLPHLMPKPQEACSLKVGKHIYTMKHAIIQCGRRNTQGNTIYRTINPLTWTSRVGKKIMSSGYQIHMYQPYTSLFSIKHPRVLFFSFHQHTNMKVYKTINFVQYLYIKIFSISTYRQPSMNQHLARTCEMHVLLKKWVQKKIQYAYIIE